MKPVVKVEYWTCDKKTHRHPTEKAALRCMETHPKKWEILAKKNKALKEEIEKLKQAVSNARIDIITDLVISKSMSFDHKKLLADILRDEQVNQTQIEQKINYVLETLTDREAVVIRCFYSDRNFTQIGKLFDLTGTRIKQIRDKALRKLRHPSRVKVLRSAEFIEKPTEERIREELQGYLNEK